MLYTKNQIRPTIDSVLESLEYLDESECIYDPCMVPIRHNFRLDQDMIQLESMVEYVLDSGINDCYTVIENICEANGVPMDNISFMVNQVSLYENDNLADTALQLHEHGYAVNIAPISSNNIYYMALEEALDIDNALTFEESYILQQYVFDENFITNAYNKVADRVSSNWENIKNSSKETVKGISNKIASIEKKISDNYNKLKTTAGSARDAIKNQITKLKGALTAAKEKAIDIKNKVSKNFSDGADWAREKISNAKDSVSNGAGWVKDKIIGAKDAVANKFSDGAEWTRSKVVGAANTVGNAFGQKKQFV